MSDEDFIPGTDSVSDEEESCTEDDFEGIDAGFDENTLTRRVYSKSSEALLSSIEGLWREYFSLIVPMAKSKSIDLNIVTVVAESGTRKRVSNQSPPARSTASSFGFSSDVIRPCAR